MVFDLAAVGGGAIVPDTCFYVRHSSLSGHDAARLNRLRRQM
jgi:hypothetical protein